MTTIPQNVKNKCLILLILSCFFLSNSFADNNPGKDTYIFSTVDYQQGLSNSAILSVFQDNAGLMWFGTYDGLDCYDGKEMETYHADSSTGLTNNVIYRIQQADSSCLWITAGVEVNRFSPISRQVVASYDFKDAFTLHSNSKGNTWVLGHGWLAYYNTRLSRFERVNCPPMQINDLTTQAFVTEDGMLWVFPSAGSGVLHQFTLDSFEHDAATVKLQTFTTTFHAKTVDYIYYQNDVFCFVDADKDLYMHDISRKSTIYLRNIGSLVQKYGVIKGIVPFYEDVIIAFWTNGLIRLRTSQKYAEEIINQNIRVFDVYKDSKQGILWVGSDGQGAFAYAKKYSIATNLMLGSLSPNLTRQVRSLMTDRYGGLWFGTKGDGLLHVPHYREGLDAEKITIHFPGVKKNVASYSKGYEEFTVFALQQSHFMDGFWVGAGSGLFYYTFKDKTLHRVVDKSDSGNVQIHSIYEANDSTLYLATYGQGFRKVLLDKTGGRVKLKDQKVYPLTHEDRELMLFFSMVAEGDSILWLGCRDRGGVVRFNRYTEEYKVISLKSLHPKAVDDVLSIYRFADGKLHVGTTSGLVTLNFDGNQVAAEYVGREQGFLNDMIHGILKDANDLLWLGTNKGLIKYNPRNRSSHSYYYTGGVQVGEFSDDAYYKCPYTGNLFFGGIDGLLYLEQEVAAAPEFYPDMLLRKLYIGRNEAPLTNHLTKGELRFKSSENSLLFKFVVPDYVSGADVEYSYMLQGYSDDWSAFSSVSEASFSNIPVGNYVLRIRYKKDVFNTDYKHYSVPLRIVPYWYQTTLAQVVYLVLAVLLILYVCYLLKKYYHNLHLMKKMQFLEQQNTAPRRTESLQERDLINAFTIIYEVCDQLRAENTTYEQRCQKVELIRETIMVLLFSNNLLSHGEGEKISPVNFTISGRMCLRELAVEVLQQFKNRGDDTACIRIEIPETFSFELYKNALRSFFYYIYSFTYYHKDATGIAINAVEENGKMCVMVTSETNLVEKLHKVLLSDEPLAADIKPVDEAFQMRMLRHFVLSALGQMCDDLKYESSEGFHRITFVFPPVQVPKETASKKTVLLLEDREEMVWLITAILSSEYNVQRVKTVQAAFEYIRQTPPALFLVDMLMYADAEDTFMEYINKNRTLLSKIGFVPMLTWKAATSIQQELIKWSDSHVILPYDILFLNKVLHKAVYGKQEAKQIYVEELGDFADLVVCSTNEQAEFIRKFLQVVEQNLDKEDLGSTFIADRLAMSPRQFYRKFKEISGMPPGDLIKNYRMEKAARLLMNEELSIQDVISDVGISSRSYFYKEFTRKFGTTPKDYRESHKK